MNLDPLLLLTEAVIYTLQSTGTRPALESSRKVTSANSTQLQMLRRGLTSLDSVHYSFSLPFSNGHIERMFSSLKVIKIDRRTNLQPGTLSDLLEIKVEGPNLGGFSADQAVVLWWEDCKTT